MAGYAIHIAIAQEYLRKHNINYSKEFIEGTCAPDLTNDKKVTHYGKSPVYTSLSKYLENNNVETLYDQGYFLHLLTDYLFYNYYLDKVDKETLHNDYDCTNKSIIEKYNVNIIDIVKDKVFYKDENPKILTLELAYKTIDEISDYNIEDVIKEVRDNYSKWYYYKNLL